MFFDPRPKNRKEDLYDREKELASFLRAQDYTPLIVITGLRRTGKTSFLNVALSESNQPYAILDLRGLPYNPANAAIIQRLEAAFNGIDRKWFSGIAEALKHLNGVSILGNHVTFSWGKAAVDLPEVFGKINDWAAKEGKHFLMAFDEIQLIRGDKWIPQFFAYVADSYRNVTLVLTGSECGLMFDFLGFDDPKAPLYGRHFVQIQMANFTATESQEFLIKGLQQIGSVAPSDVIHYVVENLDGVAGWLTLFGTRCKDKHDCSKALVDEVASEAGRLAREEATKLATVSKRYAVILNFLAKVTSASWGQLKTVVQSKEEHSLSSSAISKVLNTLVKTGFVEKTDDKYAIADLLLIKGIKEEALPE